MRIAFFSEIGTDDGLVFSRNFNNIRTDVAWAISLNCKIYSFTPRYFPDIDLAIIICPKKNPAAAIDFYNKFKLNCRIWANQQEGPQTSFQDWAVDIQIHFLQFLNDADLILCHNEFDVRYYKGLIPNKNVSILQSLMIEDSIPVEAKKAPQERNGTMVGGNWVSWYSGQDSYFIAQEFGEKIYAPSMGRKQEYEDYLEDIHYLQYMNWSQWITELNKRKYAVHLMRTWAAGTFALNCAYLGIPCIGYSGLDTQRICFPELSVELGDLEKARKIAKHLKNNELFYNHCSEYAKKAYYDNYREEVFLQKFKQTIGELECPV